MNSWKENNSIYRIKEHSSHNFEGVWEKIYKGEYEILNVRKISYSIGAADIKIDIPSLKGKRLEVEWSSGWDYPSAADRLYFNVYEANVSPEDPFYWETLYSHVRFYTNGNDQKKVVAESRLASSIKSYINEHRKEILKS